MERVRRPISTNPRFGKKKKLNGGARQVDSRAAMVKSTPTGLSRRRWRVTLCVFVCACARASRGSRRRRLQRAELQRTWLGGRRRRRRSLWSSLAARTGGGVAWAPGARLLGQGGSPHRAKRRRRRRRRRPPAPAPLAGATALSAGLAGGFRLPLTPSPLLAGCSKRPAVARCFRTGGPLCPSLHKRPLPAQP